MDPQVIFIITGEQGEGKTNALFKLINLLKKSGLTMKGFCAPGEWEKGLRSRFYLNDINSKTTMVLCQNIPENGFKQMGRFFFNPETISSGERLIDEAKPNELIVIDEIGRFEMQSKIWGPVLEKKLMENSNPLLLTMRKQFLDELVKHFKMIRIIVFDCKADVKSISEKIHSILKIGQNELF